MHFKHCFIIRVLCQHLWVSPLWFLALLIMLLNTSIFKVGAREMSVKNAERIVSSLFESLLSIMNYSDNLIPLNLLQRMCVLLDVITAQMPSPAQIGLPIAHSVMAQCRNITDLGCICDLQIKIISGNSINNSFYHVTLISNCIFRIPHGN